jgi:hypothetical protein
VAELLEHPALADGTVLDEADGELVGEQVDDATGEWAHHKSLLKQCGQEMRYSS